MGRSIITFLLLIVAVCVFWFWTRPLLAQIDTLKAERDSFNQALDKSKELQTLRDSILENYNSISQGDIDRLSKMLPAEPETAKLLVQLSDMATESGSVILNSLDAQETKNPASASLPSAVDYQEVNIRMSFSANYNDFRSFMDKIQSSLRLMDMEQIDFFAADASSYDFNINAKAYYKK